MCCICKNRQKGYYAKIDKKVTTLPICNLLHMSKKSSNFALVF